MAFGEDTGFVEMREAKKKRSAIAAMQKAGKMIEELGPDLDLRVL